MTDTTTQWAEHTCQGQRVARCTTCGSNARPVNIGTDEPCSSCLIGNTIPQSSLRRKPAPMPAPIKIDPWADVLRFDPWARKAGAK